MANIQSMFESKYIKSSDIGDLGAKRRLQIAFVEREEIDGDNGKERKPVLHFKGAKKGLILNRTNANTLDAVFGPETDDWTGKTIEVYVTEVEYKGKASPGMRMRAVVNGDAQGRAPDIQSGGVRYAGNARDDDRVRQSLPDDRVGGKPVVSGSTADLDDEIPFAPEWR